MDWVRGKRWLRCLFIGLHSSSFNLRDNYVSLSDPQSKNFVSVSRKLFWQNAKPNALMYPLCRSRQQKRLTNIPDACCRLPWASRLDHGVDRGNPNRSHARERPSNGHSSQRLCMIAIWHEQGVWWRSHWGCRNLESASLCTGAGFIAPWSQRHCKLWQHLHGPERSCFVGDPLGCICKKEMGTFDECSGLDLDTKPRHIPVAWLSPANKLESTLVAKARDR